MKIMYSLKFKTDEDAIIDIQRSAGESCVLTAYKRDGQPCRMELEDYGKKSPYTYAEVDLPEWWDGRPIKGYAWDDRQPTRAVGYLIGIIKSNPYPFIVDVEGDSIEYTRYKYFEPITSAPTKVTIEKDGVKREIELTDEQVEALGL